ncbi:Alpha/beta hydrolase domain-containing protein aho-3 [Frankliniella fusca]|uniref:Alpha/beta hydrolase domain-containing protein aho-3 n=1 Tax=Frankliniella fusca TaxID=407009 RepID=A0AAE1HYA9_9NEOP|nr:Alpha/beta hydrolase domain-containing protein aho-3 [Frankliniella fusca]
MLVDVKDVEGLLAGCPARPEGSRCVGLEVKGESAAGENYGSTFLIVDAVFQDGAGATTRVPAVCKRLPPSEYLREVFNVKVSHPKEVNFYRKLVPALEALQAELGVPQDERIRCFPRLYGARVGGGKDPDEVDDDAILVLEDLSVAGYRSGDRNLGVDLDHCRLAVRELARMHALGIVMRRLRPEVFHGPAFQDTCVYFKHDCMAEAHESLRAFEDNSLALLLDKVPEVLELADEDTLRRGVRTLTGRDMALRREPFYTVLHNDFWVNNMMFAYDGDARPDRLKMVDFQITEIGSPVQDLLFFLFSSADSAALRQVDQLVREYHAELERYARLHGLDGDDLGWSAFQRELDAEAPDALGHLLVMINILRADKAIEKEDTNSVDAFSSGLGMSPAARTRYLETVRAWVSRGWLR